MRTRNALGLCALACVSVAASLVAIHFGPRTAQAADEIPKMALFDLPPSYGRSAVDIPNLNERGPTRLTSDQGSIRLPIRYQIKTTTSFAETPHRLVVNFFEPGSSAGKAGERDEVPEPIGSWTSPPFKPGDQLHINEATQLTLPCPPGTYRVSISVQRYFEGIERTRGLITEWQAMSTRTYPEVVVR